MDIEDYFDSYFLSNVGAGASLLGVEGSEEVGLRIGLIDPTGVAVREGS